MYIYIYIHIYILYTILIYCTSKENSVLPFVDVLLSFLRDIPPKILALSGATLDLPVFSNIVK